MRQRDMARLDREIAGLLGWTTVRGSDTYSLGVDPSTRTTEYIPRYSADLNAVVQACEEAGLMWQMGRHEAPEYWVYVWWSANSSDYLNKDAATPALALSLALRSALESKTD